MPPSELLGNWSTWWQGDACGVLIFTPLILSWAGKLRWQPRRLAEAAVFGVLLLGAAQIVFHGSGARTFLIVPFVVWAAFRFGQRGVTTAIAAVCAMALWYTLVAEARPLRRPADARSAAPCCCSSSPRWCSPAWCSAPRCASSKRR